MAIIGEIRKHYWLLVAIIGVALLLFVLSDFQRKRTKTTTNIGVVAGEKLAVTEFNKKVEENTELQKANTGKQNLTPEENYQLRESTWQQMINEIIMTKQFDKLGVAVSVDELDDLIRGKNPHPYIVQSFTDPKTGKFDQKAVTNFLQNLDQVDPAMKQRYIMMEKAIKEDRLNTKYNNLITKGFYVPTAIAKRAYTENNTMAAIRIAGIRYNAVSDSAVKVTDADYQKYYDDNKYKFIQDRPVRNVVFVTFEPKMSAEDIAAMKANAAKVYDEFVAATDISLFVNSVSDTRYDSSWHKKGTFSPLVDSMLFSAPIGQVLQPVEDKGMFRIFKVMAKQSMPDSLRASHILIAFAGSAVQGATRTQEAASKLADSIFNIVKGNPAAFDALAATKNDDQSVVAKNGDLGWFADGAMVPAFNAAVMSGSEGEIKKVETQFGYHIIKITGKKNPSTKIKVASVDYMMEPGAATIEKYYNEASEFAAANNTIEKFESAVKTKNLTLRNADMLSENDNTLPGLKSGREIVRWSFNKETEKGAVSNVFDVDGTYVVAALKNKVDKGTIPLDVIKDPLKPLVVREKKAEYIIGKVNAALAKQKDFAAVTALFPTVKIDTANVSFASSNIPNFGREPKLTGQIFSAKPGLLSAPVQGDQAVYVYLLDALKPAPETADYKTQKRQMESAYQSRANVVQSILQEKAKIKDNRLLFY